MTRDEKRVKNKVYYDANREEILARRRKPELVESRSVYMADWYQKNKARLTEERREYLREYNLINRPKLSIQERARWLSKYGMTLDDYEVMFNLQEGKCAICRQPETSLKRSGELKPLAVDHDHATGDVRGLLCTLCNTGIGCLRDDPLLLTAAISYLSGPV